jgi:hypothetical protein
VSKVNTMPRLRDVVCESKDAESALGRDIVRGFYLRSIGGAGGASVSGGYAGETVNMRKSQAESGTSRRNS